MKRSLIIICVTMIAMIALSPAVRAGETLLGVWMTIDDETKKAKSHIEIYEQGGVYFARIIKLLEAGKGPDTLCDKCTGEKFNKPVVSMIIMWGMKKKNDTQFQGGRILDPGNGKDYGCNITIENENKLKVRGFVGFSLLGRTQHWYRVKN